jgi:hypothetical protein
MKKSVSSSTVTIEQIKNLKTKFENLKEYL